MASSNSSRNNGASDRAESSENLFVKFKHAVDDNVSSVLQGIIGLPSILSRGPNGANGRWPELETTPQRSQDDLQRADKQRYASESAANEVEIPVKRFAGRPSGADDAPERPDYGEEDYDLYSTFNQYFMNRIDGVPKGNPWLQYQHEEKFRWCPDATGGSVEECIQQRFRASLGDLLASNGHANTIASDEKTLVPYLLFSPYSPLALMRMPPLQPKVDPFWRNRDEFTYCDAFEDLLLSSRNEPMREFKTNAAGGLLQSVLSGTEHWPGPRYGFFLNREAGRRLTLADLGMIWMGTALVEKDILREGSLYEPSRFDAPFGTTYNMKPSLMLSVLHNYIDKLHEYRGDGTQQAGPGTEQDMYDRFFPLSSKQAHNNEEVGSTLGELLTVLGGAGRIVSDIFRDFDSEEQIASFEQTTSNVTQTESSDLNGQLVPGACSYQNRHESLEENLEDVVPLQEEQASTPIALPKGERVISSKTSTEQRTEEDGTVRTTVVIEKRFEDGRKSVTRTTHVQSPTWGEPEGKNQDDAASVNEGNDSNDGNDGKKKGKGWFWN